MATLEGGTTIAGYLAIHAGNLDEQNIATKGFGGAGENIKVLVNQDLNTIQTTGNYLAENSTNAPESGWGFLIVSAYNDGSTSTRIFQIYKHDITNKIYYRHYSSSWSTWVNIANFSDIPTKTSQITNDGDGTSNFVTANQLGNAGYGDMTKAQYDTNSNGVVDKAEKLATARKINGVNFDGTDDINISASANGGTSSFLGNAVNVSDYNALNPSVIAQGNITPIKAPNTANSPWNNTTSGFLIQSNDNDSFHILIFRSGGDGWSYRSWYQGTWSSWKIWSTFDGNYNSLSNKPTSFPANGGNADTIGGKSASDFAPSGYGLAGTAKRLGSVDLNTVTANGWYDASNVTNGVTDIGIGYHKLLVVCSADNNYITQLAFAMTTGTVGSMYIREKRAGTWSSWSRIVQGYDLQRITQDTSTQPTNQLTGGVWLKPV